MSSDGLYFIFSAIGNGERHVNRAPIEDLSLRPKYIWTLHIGTRANPWVVQKVSSKKYSLKSQGAPTGIDSSDPRNVYAFIIPEFAKSLDWDLEPVNGGSVGGREAFKIKSTDGSVYWTTAEDERAFGRLIELRPKSDGPEQVFYLHRLSEEVVIGAGSPQTQVEQEDDSQSRFSYGKREKKFCA